MQRFMHCVIAAALTLSAMTAQAQTIVFKPDLKNFKALDLSNKKDKAARYFPVWDEADLYEDEGLLYYNVNLGYDMPLQQLYQGILGTPNDKNEVGRVILIDLNKDGATDALVCLGSYGSDHTLYYDAYVWDEDNFGGLFTLVENFRNIPNPGLHKETSCIIGTKGTHREVWGWDSKTEIVKYSEDIVPQADGAATNDKDEIVNRMTALYDVIAQRKEEGTGRFACHTWWDMVAAVEQKDAGEAEIGFFNDDLWTQMQDENPDKFELRDIKFEELDVEKGSALVDFVLYSSIQTVHQKFRFCREDGDWRVHDIIRFFPDGDGKETESDLMKAMQNYLKE